MLFLIVSALGIYAQEVAVTPSQFKFIENKGQWPDQVTFRAEVPGGFIWLEKGKFNYQFKSYPSHHAHQKSKKKSESDDVVKQHVVWAEFIGANEEFTVTKTQEQKEYYNFYLGNDQAKWSSNCKAYGDITYHNLYQGIDLRVYEKNFDLKYDFILKPYTENNIKLRYSGFDKIKVNNKGALEIETSLGQIREENPYAYQIINGKIIEVGCKFKLNDNIVEFDLETYDERVPLIIDPILVFASYSGSYSDNFGMTATYDYNGNMFSGGMAFGNAYPTTPGVYNDTSTFSGQAAPVFGITDVVITKYSADGTTRLYSTYLGGGTETQGTETVHSLIADTDGNLYLYGVTSSENFPVTSGSYDETFNGGNLVTFAGTGTYFSNNGTDIYVAKFNPDGSNLLACTYVGGSGNDGVNYNVSPNSVDSLVFNYGDYFRGEIMLDESNNVYVGTSTRSSDFPTVNAYQNTMNGVYDGVVFKLNNDLTSMDFSTYLGGSLNDAIYSVKINENQEVVVAGGTVSNDFPNTTGVYQESFQGGIADGFISILAADGSSLVASTFVGTTNYDQNYFIEIDRWNNIYTVGQTEGSTPISSGVFSNPNSGQFLTKFSPDLTSMDLYTEFGNSDGEIDISPSAFLVDFCGNVYVCGWGARINPVGTPLSGMPVSNNAFQSVAPNGYDFYLIVLSRNFEDLLYASYLGGGDASEHVDGGTSRFDKNGVVYQSVCGGCGGNSDFPTTPGAVSDTNLSSNCNNLVFKFDFEIVPKAQLTASSTEGCAPFEIEFQNFSSDSTNYIWYFGDGDSTFTEYNPTHIYDTPGTYIVELLVTDTICNLTDTARTTITIHDSLLLEVPNDTVVCGSPNLTLVANSFGTATQYVWSSSSDLQDTLNVFPAGNTLNISPSGDITYYVEIKNPWCTLLDSVQITFINSAIDLVDEVTVCQNASFDLEATNQNPMFTFDYQWAPPQYIVSGQGSNEVTVNVPDSMYIYLTATATNGCVLLDSVWVNANFLDPLLVDAYADQDTIPAGSTVQLFGAPDGYSYSWFPPETLNNSSAQNPVATPVDEVTTYMLTVSDGVCSDTALVTIRTVEYSCDFPNIFVPNSFTPNGDGENDVLYVRGKYLVSMEFKVFDRWGELVFESNEAANGWDGTFKGSSLEPDTYVYHLKADCGTGEQLIKGNVTILR